MDEVNNTTQGTVNGSTIPQAERQSATDTVEIVVDSKQIAQVPQVPQIANDGVTPAQEEKQPNPIGRPCEYCRDKEKILQITNDYLASRSSIEKPRMPYWGELAILLDKDDETLTLWAQKEKEDGSLEHPDFSALKKKFNSVQHLRLQQRLMGRYNPTGSIMWLKTKYGYIETDKRVLAGDATTPLEIIITEEDRKKDGE